MWRVNKNQQIVLGSREEKKRSVEEGEVGPHANISGPVCWGCGSERTTLIDPNVSQFHWSSSDFVNEFVHL